MISKTIAAIVGVGTCASAAAFIANPSLYPATLTACGGALGGAAIVNEIRRKEEERAVEATRVATAFNGLYELNKGLVSPQQLSLLAGVPLEKTSVFLRALGEQQNGKLIQTQKGEVYNFSHPNSVLDQLTANAQEWAKSQTDPLLQENATLKAELSQLMAFRARQQMPIQQTILKNDEDQPDPWNKLL